MEIGMLDLPGVSTHRDDQYTPLHSAFEPSLALS